MKDTIEVPATVDLSAGKRARVKANGVDIALFNVDGRIYAIDDSCPHSFTVVRKTRWSLRAMPRPWAAFQPGQRLHARGRDERARLSRRDRRGLHSHHCVHPNHQPLITSIAG